VNRLEPQQQFDIAKKMKEDHIVSGHLEEFIKRDINRLKEINSRRGYRLRHGLPTRGQRTHSNGKTIRRAKFLKLKN
jgi:small subunit ribosomal protein S13